MADVINGPEATSTSRRPIAHRALEAIRSFVFGANMPMLIALAVLIVVFTLSSPYFLTANNWLNIGRQIAIVAIVACGSTMVIIAGEIDLSVGALLALISVAIGIVLHDPPHDLGFDARALLALVVALSIGLGAGLLNGLLTVYGKIPSFIVTLGTLSVFRGLALTYNKSSPQPVLNQSFLETFSGADVFGLPIIVFYLLIVLLVSQYLLRGTLFGVQVYSTGGNREASRMAGVPTDRVRIAVMAVAGLLTGFAAVLATARVRTALPTLGVGLELDAIAAAILGGTRLSGGYGRILGTLLGAGLIGVINNGLTLLGVPSTLQDVIKGCLIIVAVLAIRLRSRAA